MLRRTASHLEQQRRKIFVNLLAQPADLDVNYVGLWIKMMIPHRLEERQTHVTTWSWRRTMYRRRRNSRGCSSISFIARSALRFRKSSLKSAISSSETSSRMAGTSQQRLDSREELREREEAWLNNHLHRDQTADALIQAGHRTSNLTKQGVALPASRSVWIINNPWFDPR